MTNWIKNLFYKNIKFTFYSIVLFLLIVLSSQKLISQTKDFKKELNSVKKGIKAAKKGKNNEAFTIFKNEADKDNALAQFYCGLMYSNGAGVQKDSVLAVQYIKKSAEGKYKRAINLLGDIYMHGELIKADYSEAVKWYRLAIDEGDVIALNNLGFCCELGLGLPQNKSEAVKYYRMAAEKNSSDAQYNLGTAYLKGFGVQQNYKEALFWFVKSAKQNNVEAIYTIGFLFENGFGITKFNKGAFEYYKKAAELKSPKANYKIATFYLNGTGVKLSREKAIYYFKKSLALGYDSAHSRDICPHSYLKALYKAPGDLPKDQAGIVNLGIMYLEGSGDLPKDFNQAVSLFTEACSNNEPKGCMMLALCYENGFGLRQSLIAAKMYYRKADELGYPEAKKNLERLEK